MRPATPLQVAGRDTSAILRDMSDLTSRQEAYCLARARGLTQRRAYREAYPRSVTWSDSAVDSQASRLEKTHKVSARLDELSAKLTRDVVISRGKLLSRLDDLADTASNNITYEVDGETRIHKGNADVLIRTTRELLPYATDEVGARHRFVADFALLMAPSFFEVHREIARDAPRVIDFWLGGGRGSMKSSFASLEVVNYLECHPDQHAAVFMKRKADLRDAAYAQVVWAINKLGLEDEYEMPESTLRIRKKSTGQLILFRGVDNANKVKSIKVPFGHIGIEWFEEADQFCGMAEIRKVNQSVTRGGEGAIRLYTFNPPRSLNCWVNRHVESGLADDARYYRSCYLDAPAEWLGEQFIADAAHLKDTDPLSYEHEYLGLPVGNGTEVFDRVIFREITDAEIATFDNLKVGQDFGWYPDPWACVMSEWRQDGRTLLSFKEDSANKLTPPQMAGRVKAMLTWTEEDGKTYYHRLRVLSDDAEPQSIAPQRDCGVDARPAGKGNMRDASYRFLQSCTWVIDPKRCPELAREVREMQYEVNRDGEVLNSIPDGNDHRIDAVRYSIMPMAKRFRKAYRGQATAAE